MGAGTALRRDRGAVSFPVIKKSLVNAQAVHGISPQGNTSYIIYIRAPRTRLCVGRGFYLYITLFVLFGRVFLLFEQGDNLRMLGVGKHIHRAKLFNGIFLFKGL